jgi:hypothetical protein
MGAAPFVVNRAMTFLVLAGGLLAVPLAGVSAQERPFDSVSRPARSAASHSTVLSTADWARLDRAVDRGLAFLASRQAADGRFPTAANAQAAVTSLCVMAFLSRGHQPGAGRYGPKLERAIDFVLAAQDPASGAITGERSIGRDTYTDNYSHGICGLMLAEVYGADAKRNSRIRAVLIKALDYSRRQQRIPKRPDEQGGWRYVDRDESDLSVTSWQLMFYRAARNAEFDVPETWVKEATNYVQGLFDENQRSFVYGNDEDKHRYCTRGMAGAGIVCLALGGQHRSKSAQAAGEWILQNSFEPYNNTRHPEDRYHYGAFYCSQAMFQLGGEYWKRFFPPFANVLIRAQRDDGSWDVESIPGDRMFGNAYTTSLAILALATPYQLLPIYQR